MTWLAVGVGGALGALARHTVNMLIHQRSLGARFPLGILVVNVTGSFAIGLIGGVLASGRLAWPQHTRTFVIVGLLGGFTTFSSFSLEVVLMMERGQFGLALAYAALSVIVAVAALVGGLSLMRSLA